MKHLVLWSLMLFTAWVSAGSAPKNIIMVVGDGMGPEYTTAYRYFADDKQQPNVQKTVFDRNLVGMASTYPARVSGYVTDSAASATALSSGHKTYNNAVAVDVDKKETPTVLQFAKSKGMKTGIAVTSQINHATPASYAAHNESRHNYNEIADSFFDDRINDQFTLDVMLGGGWDYFIREDRNLVEEFKKAGYQYIDNVNDLQAVKNDKPLLGLFAKRGMDGALDTQGQPRLLAMTQTAVSNLENDKGFFLLVEGSQIDWAGHANDVAAAMAEMHDFAITIEWLESYVQKNPDTLVVVTADHSTGGFTLAADGDYRWDPEPLKGLKSAPRTMAGVLAEHEAPLTYAQEQLGITFDEDEKALISAMTENTSKAWYSTIKTIMDKRSNSGWTTSGHTAIDVQIFAMGKGKEHFVGFMDNTEIGDKIFALLGKTQ